MIAAMSLADGSLLIDKIGNRISRQFQLFRSSQPLLNRWPYAHPFLPPKNDRIATAVKAMDPLVASELKVACEQFYPYFRKPTPTEIAMDHRLEPLLKAYTIQAMKSNNPTADDDHQFNSTVVHSEDDQEMVAELAAKMTLNLMSPYEKMITLSELTQSLKHN